MNRDNHTERVRVIHLVERMAVGGMERNIELILHKLDPERFEQRLCCMWEAGPLAGPLMAQGVRVDVVGAKYYYRPAHFAKMWRYLRGQRPHVVHTHGEYAAIFGRMAAIAARVPVVLSHVQNVPAYVQARRHVFENRILTAMSQGVIACAQHTMRYLVEGEKIAPAKIRVVHNCVDIARIDATRPLRGRARREFGYRSEHVALGTVSRLAPVKGHRYLLRAMPAVIDAAPNVRLLIVGDGPERPKLEALADELALREHVTFTGMRSDVPDLLAGLDVFVQPTSDVEGLPLSVAEAMAAHLPVVATDVGGVREAVTDGENGFVAPARDSDALARAIVALATDPRARRAMGERSRALCEGEYSADLMVQRIDDIYTHWVHRRCPALLRL